MKWVKKEDGMRVPIKSWCDPVNDNALEQAMNLTKLPVVYRHVALMPDCHLGYGMPIGGVIAVEDAIIPNAVGVDIGCGMRAVKTDFKPQHISTEMIKEMMGMIRQSIPVGFNHHKEKVEWGGWDEAPDVEIVQQELQKAQYQLGTLGGGNHFIEIQAGDDGFIWLMVHSGSRNFGLKIANKYHKYAQELHTMNTEIPDMDLAYIPLGHKRAQEYIEAMNYALRFAEASRSEMMIKIKAVASEVLGCCTAYPIDIHHNYASWEHHFDKYVWLHRKGATQARANQWGIIPGSMGTPSYIVEGLGNKESFESCSHGAGRVMGRMEASRNLTLEECDKAMEGIVFGRWSKNRKGNLDFGEAPQAYKDIDEVIEAELDLIKPLVKLRPLGVIKG